VIILFLVPALVMIREDIRGKRQPAQGGVGAES
jgi:hypothetical protein